MIAVADDGLRTLVLTYGTQTTTFAALCGEIRTSVINFVVGKERGVDVNAMYTVCDLGDGTEGAWYCADSWTNANSRGSMSDDDLVDEVLDTYKVQAKGASSSSFS